MFIYKITNLVNGKCYIGQTTKTIEERWKGHKNHKGCKLIHRAIKKYGEDKFKVEVIVTALDTKYLDDLEILLIKESKSLHPKGYNLSKGGNSAMRGLKHTEESKQKIKIAMKKRDVSYLHSKENIEKRKKSFKKNGKSIGKPRPKSVKDKISKANSGKNHGMYGKTGFNCPNFKCAIKCLETGEIFGSQSEAAKKLNLFQQNINKVLLGTRNHTGGFTFIKLENYNV